MLTGYAYLPCRPPLPFVKVFIENVGEVVGLVDTGASVSAIRLSVVRKILNPNRVKSLLKLTGVDGKKVIVDSYCSLNVKWENQIVDLENVAVVRSCPFALILGADWIVKSKTSLIVEDDKIIAKSTEPSKPKLKKVRFAGIEDEIVNSEVGDECPLVVKDELIEALEKDGTKRRNFNHGMEVKVVESAIILAESLCFVKAKMFKNFSGNVVVRPNMCSHPGLEWIIPSCIVKVKAGRLKIPVLNMKKSVLNLRRKDLLAFVEPDFDPSVVIVDREDQPVNPACPLISNSEQPSWNALKDARIGENLSTEERNAVLALLTRRLRCFPTADGNLGYTNMAEHAIDTENAHPISCVPYRVSAPERRMIIEKVTEMLRQGIIRPSFSPWASPVVLVKKKSGDYRFCIDYRRLNAVTKRDVYPLPRMDDVFDRLAGAKFFSSLDLMSGYWQVPVAEADRSKTAFITPDGLYEFMRLPFGLNNAPSTFQRLMDRVLARLKWQMCLVYLDDVLVFGKTFEEHQKRLECVLIALEKAGLTLNVSKCIFATNRIFHLGHIIDENGIRPDPEKISALVNFKVKNVKSLRGFLGLASFYRRFVPEFAAIAHPLHVLLKKNSTWSWKEQQELAKTELVNRLVSSPVLAHFDENIDVCVQTDASLVGLGAVLTQDSGDGPRPIAYISRRLTEAESKYHANELECLAIVWALKKLRHYVYGRRFSICTDSSAVRWLWSKKEVNGKFARWILSLQEFDFEIRHVKGVNNCVADALSRNPDESCIGPSGSAIGHVVCVFDSRRPVGMSNAELAFQQQLDSQLRPIITSLNAKEPGKFWEQFKIHGKVLYRRNPSQGRKFLLCIPSILRRKVIEFCHDDPSSSHMGIDKTVARVSERYWWPKFRASVRKYVSSCSYCQFHKCIPGFPAGQLQPIPPPDRPFHTIGMDHLGPFKATSDGKKHILMAIDYLTKYVEAVAVADTSTALVAEFVKDQINFRHGGTTRIISDQGTAFSSHLMEEKVNEWRTDHVFATAEHPQTSGLVERVNRTMTLALAAYVNVDHDDWDRHLPAAIFAINTARQSTTEISPFQLVYGRLPFTTLENEFPWPKERPEPVNVFLSRVEEMRNAARLNIIEKQEKVKRLVDLRRRIVKDLYPGELVLVRRKLKKKGKTKKLLPKYVGPFQVVKKVCPTTYLVEDLPAQRKKKRFRRFNAHVVQIRKFHPREDAEWDDWPDEPEESIEIQPSSGQPAEKEASVESAVPDQPTPVQINPPEVVEPPLQPTTTRAGRKVVRPSWMKNFVA